MVNPVFLSAGIGQWYSSGVDRLRGTLIDKKWPGDIRLFKDEWPDEGFSREVVYNVKPAAFTWALKEGYTTIVWGDASITAERSMDVFLTEINEKGYWIGQSGYNAAQTCNDASLAYFNVTRDQAEKIPDCATGLFGVDLNFPWAREFLETWIQSARDGAFAGSRFHDGQSGDPRFAFHRQDQSAATLILGKMGLPLELFQRHVRFKWDTDEGQTFKCEGM
jgi:hypothetical protein